MFSIDIDSRACPWMTYRALERTSAILSSFPRNPHPVPRGPLASRTNARIWSGSKGGLAAYSRSLIFPSRSFGSGYPQPKNSYIDSSVRPAS